MSGHSKWSNIKRKKGAADAAKASVFTKIGREIAVAVKTGGADPTGNSRLRDVILKAKQNNMPNDNIARSIKKASGELSNVNYEEMTYEGYAPCGVAVIVEALTDNKNRTASDVRHIFDKYGGALGSTGCVSYMFTRKGVIVAERVKGADLDEMMMLALEAGADDIIEYDDVFEVYTAPATLSEVADNLRNAGVNVLSQESSLLADNYIDLDAEGEEKVKRIIGFLEENEDVQNVYHNANLTEEEEE